MGVIDSAKAAVAKVKSDIDTGNKETEGLGAELSARSQMNRLGEAALRSSSDTPPKMKDEPERPHKPVPYTDANKPKGWERISDDDIRKFTKPLGSLKTGTPYVPKTGMYQLHEGEAVVPKEKNTMNAADAMMGITGKAKPPKKIHTIKTHKSDDGKLIHTHQHHHAAHHPDETHISNNMKEATDHMTAMEPNMSAQPPEMPAPQDAGAAGGAGASPAATPAM